MKKWLKNTSFYHYLQTNFKKIEEVEQTNKEILENLKSTQEEIKKVQVIEISAKEKINEFEKKLEYVQNQVSQIKKRTDQFEYGNIELLPYIKLSKEKQKVLLIGFYGAYNTGDELMLQALLTRLQEKESLEITVMIADNTKYELEYYTNVHFIHYPKTHADINIITNYFDKSIFGGGALIDDKEYENESVKWSNVGNLLIDISISGIRRNKEIYLVGLSTSDEFINKKYLEKLAYIFSNATYISLRDPYSLETLKKKEIDCSKVEQIEDIVFDLEEISPTKKDQEKYCLGIILIGYIDDEKMTKIIHSSMEFLNNTIVDKQKKIKLIPFYDYCNFEYKRYVEFLEKYNSKYIDIEIEIEDYVSDYKRVVELFYTCNMIVSTRYHGSLLALKCGIPAVHINYDVHRHYINKMQYLEELYQVQEYSVSLKNFKEEEYKKALELAYQNAELLVEMNKETTNKIKIKNDEKMKEIVDSIAQKKE